MDASLSRIHICPPPTLHAEGMPLLMHPDRALSAAERVFAIPELLEEILTYLLCQLFQTTDAEDPKSVRVHGNARVLQQLLRMTGVSRSWRRGIDGSKRLQRALFLLPNHSTPRSWTHSTNPLNFWVLGTYFTAGSPRAPELNPIIQSTFTPYEFRFWRLDPEKTGNKHCASLIIPRKHIPALNLRAATGQGKSISNMLLSQPPCTALQATIQDERDETKDYVGRTSVLKNPVIRSDDGVTIGMVHVCVSRMFDEHRDVAVIKLTTI